MGEPPVSAGGAPAASSLSKKRQRPQAAQNAGKRSSMPSTEPSSYVSHTRAPSVASTLGSASPAACAQASIRTRASATARDQGLESA